MGFDLGRVASSERMKKVRRGKNLIAGRLLTELVCDVWYVPGDLFGQEGCVRGEVAQWKASC